MFSTIQRRLILGCWLAVLWLCTTTTAPVQADQLVGLTTNNSIVIFNSEAPGILLNSVGVTGLPAGAVLQGIDFRPATGGLVGVALGPGTVGGVYSINPLTGAATLISTNPITLTGTAFGVDFNPVPDALRIVSNTGQNLRITAGGTGVVNVDGTLNPAPQGTGVVAAAYANNVPGGNNGVTTLFDINATLGSLFIQNPPNNGTLVTVGSLGLGTNLTTQIGFDIAGSPVAPFTGTAFASFDNLLRTLDLNTGVASASLGTIAGNPIRDISVSQFVLIPEPSSILLFGLGVTSLVGYGWRRRR